VAGRAEDARKAAEKAVELAGTAANYALLAQAAHAAGNQQKAEEALKKAMQLAPGRPEWERLREMILQETSARQSGQP